MYVLSIDIAKISRGLQFVCNDLLWLQEPVRAAKILMRCQTSHLYKLQPSVSTHCTQFCTFTKIQFTKFTIVNTTFTSNSHPPVHMIELTYSSDMNSVMDEVKVWGINHIWKFSNVWMFNF